MSFMARNRYLHPTVSSSVAWGFRAIFPSVPGCGRAFYSQGGFSLLELLLVLFILGLMATSAALLTQGVEDQSKYDETKRRMEIIKRAIIGDSSRTINGGPEISGFVADMGRLPSCLRELVDGKCDDADPSPTSWSIDADTGLGRGWRGPYLDVMPDSDGIARLRDAYGCEWNFPTSASSVEIQSYGMDCQPGGGGAAHDIPQSGVMELIGEDDYLSQDTLLIDFYNQSPASAVTVNPADWTVALEQTDAALVSLKIDGATSSVTIAAGGNKLAEAKFDRRLPMGTYFLELDCPGSAVCSGINNDISDGRQIVLIPRHQIPYFKWVIGPQ